MQTPAARAKRSASLRRYWAGLSPAQRAAVVARRNGRTGGWAAQGRVRCDTCGFESNPPGITRHQGANDHTGRTRLPAAA